MSGWTGARDNALRLWRFQDEHPDVAIQPYDPGTGFAALVPHPDGQTVRVTHPDDLGLFVDALERSVAAGVS